MLHLWGPGYVGKKQRHPSDCLLFLRMHSGAHLGCTQAAPTHMAKGRRIHPRTLLCGLLSHTLP